jgi:hypothetical protein
MGADGCQQAGRYTRPPLYTDASTRYATRNLPANVRGVTRKSLVKVASGRFTGTCYTWKPSVYLLKQHRKIYGVTIFSACFPWLQGTIAARLPGCQVLGNAVPREPNPSVIFLWRRLSHSEPFVWSWHVTPAPTQTSRLRVTRDGPFGSVGFREGLRGWTYSGDSTVLQQLLSRAK